MVGRGSFVALIGFLLQLTSCSADNTSSDATSLLDRLLSDYDKRFHPGFYKRVRGPTLVDVNLNIRSMGPISEMDMAYQMDCYFRQQWTDRRLQFNGNETLRVSINVLERLWKPDTHVFNGRQSYLHVVTSPNKLLRIDPDGSVLYSMRLTIKASCPMHLEKFPMDTQTCPLILGSHGYTLSDVVYRWMYGDNKSVKMAPDMTLSQFDLVGIKEGQDNKTIQFKGVFSMLWVHFRLRRHMGYFLINVYVPCGLLVVLSWVGFWINREATSDRIALGITNVLTMAFLGIDNRRDLPKVSYSTALDYFVGMCFAFILATILQFAMVHFFTKVGSGESLPHESEEEDDDEDTKQRMKKSYNTCNGHLRRYKTEVTFPRRSCFAQLLQCIAGNHKYKDSASSMQPGVNSVSEVDMLSRVLFPLLFVVLNLGYWVFYLQGVEGDVLM